ncbi:MAG TPA: TonB family protein [bacterium]|nr:TonB family protein [bacterium]
MSAASNISIDNSSALMREFRRPFFNLDTRFLVILLLAIFVESVFVIIMMNRPVSEYSDKEIARIQERFANFVLREASRSDREAERIGAVTGAREKPEEQVKTAVSETDSEAERSADDSATDEERSESQRGAGFGERSASSAEASEARRLSRERVSQEVSNRGLLALLTGTGSAAEGQAVKSVFEESAVSGGNDLDKVLSSVEGIRTGGRQELEGGGIGSGGVRGQRSGRQATIDDLVSERPAGEGEQASLTRKGDVMVEKPSEVQGTGTRSQYRSAEAIQEVLMSHNPAIRYCYERELKRNPALKGKITVRITVEPEGNVSDAVILASTLNNERVERCILARIRLWKDFPPIDPSEGSVTFRQVYAFGV